MGRAESFCHSDQEIQHDEEPVIIVAVLPAAGPRGVLPLRETALQTTLRRLLQSQRLWRWKQLVAALVEPAGQPDQQPASVAGPTRRWWWVRCTWYAALATGQPGQRRTQQPTPGADDDAAGRAGTQPLADLCSAGAGDWHEHRRNYHEHRLVKHRLLHLGGVD